MHSPDILNIEYRIIGHSGFIGKNLLKHLQSKGYRAACFDENEFQVVDKSRYWVIINCAGVNRADQPDLFYSGNVSYALNQAKIIIKACVLFSYVYLSSTQVDLSNDYGRSKLLAENQLRELMRGSPGKLLIYRLPNVYGKWSRPNHNSVVATFCDCLHSGKEMDVHNSPGSRYVYIDDLCKFLMETVSTEISDVIDLPNELLDYRTPRDIFNGLLFARDFINATVLNSYPKSRFEKNLLSVYLAFAPSGYILSCLDEVTDHRGSFATIALEFGLGQWGIVSIAPGRSRGGHYHHTKFERFYVLSGMVDFEIWPVDKYDSDTDKRFSLTGKRGQIISISPGYSHTLVNAGSDEAVVLIWANEIFDPNDSDTYVDCRLVPA